MKDLANSVSAVQSIAPVVGSSDTNGTGVDLQFFESAVVVVSTGVEGDTLSGSFKFDFKLRVKRRQYLHGSNSGNVCD